MAGHGCADWSSLLDGRSRTYSQGTSAAASTFARQVVKPRARNNRMVAAIYPPSDLTIPSRFFVMSFHRPSTNSTRACYATISKLKASADELHSSMHYPYGPASIINRRNAPRNHIRRHKIIATKGHFPDGTSSAFDTTEVHLHANIRTTTTL